MQVFPGEIMIAKFNHFQILTYPQVFVCYDFLRDEVTHFQLFSVIIKLSPKNIVKKRQILQTKKNIKFSCSLSPNVNYLMCV